MAIAILEIPAAILVPVFARTKEATKKSHPFRHLHAWHRSRDDRAMLRG